MSFGEAVMRWSVRLSVILMVAAWMLMLRRPKSGSPARGCWAAGYLAFLVHLWAAFEYVHHWSHSHAVQDTARRTRELVGLDWGGGVWWNYLFAVVWGVDVLWWSVFPSSHERRPRWVGANLHGFLGFIAFNATVVFADGVSRWLGVAGCILLIIEAWRSRGGSQNASV